MRVHLRVIVFIWNYHSGCWGNFIVFVESLPLVPPCRPGTFYYGPILSNKGFVSVVVELVIPVLLQFATSTSFGATMGRRD